MPMRLLFVDDEPMILSGLRRTLHGMRAEWDMRFVLSASEALQALQSEPYDAIISDMRMPLMDGAQLLEKVKLLYPHIIRVVLSGQSSQASVLRSIAPAHQLLSKPCDPQELVLRLGQAFAMRDLLSNQALKTVISRMRSLPSLPSLYEELMAALRSENPSLGQMERIISRDMGMTAKILQLANSPFLGTRGRISSLLQALTLIGTETVRTLVLSVDVFSQFERNSGAAEWLPTLWEHSAQVAALAQQITASENCPKAMVEESFTAGLLHDLGKVVLLAEMPREYRRAIESDSGDITARELKYVGCTHGQVGAYLISLWGLPVPLIQTVAFHHSPSQTDDATFSSLTAVHVADAIAGASKKSQMNFESELDLNYLDRLGLRDRESRWRALGAEHSTAGPSKEALDGRQRAAGASNSGR